MPQTERHVRLFRNGRNQAVRIPREFELEGEEAIMRKEEAERKRKEAEQRRLAEREQKRKEAELMAKLETSPPEVVAKYSNASLANGSTY